MNNTSTLRVTLLTTLSAVGFFLLSACGASSVPGPSVNNVTTATRPAGAQIRGSHKLKHIDTSALISNVYLSKGERRLLLSFFLSAPLHPFKRPTAKNTFLALAFIDAKGHIVRQFGNRPSAVIKVKRSVPVPDESGPYHQVITGTPTDSYNYATVNLPCGGTIPDYTNDDFFVYLGGKTDESGSEVESGEQFNPHPENLSSKNWQPYMRVGGGSEISYPGNGGSYASGSLGGSESGTGAGGHWYCDLLSYVPLDLSFWNQVADDWTASSNTYYDCFGNESYQEGGDNEIYWGECHTPGFLNNEDGAWKHWFSENTARTGDCAECKLMQTTSIAQAVQTPDDGAYFGPVAWSQMRASGYGTEWTPYTTCINKPAWPGTNQCGDTPGTNECGVEYVICVSNQDLYYPGEETDLIDNDLSW